MAILRKSTKMRLDLESRGFYQNHFRFLVARTVIFPFALVILSIFFFGILASLIAWPSGVSLSECSARIAELSNNHSLYANGRRFLACIQYPGSKLGSSFAEGARFGLLLGALLLALFRWTSSRKEAGMNSYLEHRTAVNGLIWQSAQGIAEEEVSGRSRSESEFEEKGGGEASGPGWRAASRPWAISGLRWTPWSWSEAPSDGMQADEFDDEVLVSKLQHDVKEVLEYANKAWSDGISNALTDLFVYAELDILEMSFIKYREGMMTPEAAIRMTDIMISRCSNQKFRSAAVSLVEKGMYVPGFQLAVRKIATMGVQQRDEAVTF